MLVLPGSAAERVFGRVHIQFHPTVLVQSPVLTERIALYGPTDDLQFRLALLAEGPPHATDDIGGSLIDRLLRSQRARSDHDGAQPMRRDGHRTSSPSASPRSRSGPHVARHVCHIPAIATLANRASVAKSALDLTKTTRSAFRDGTFRAEIVPFSDDRGPLEMSASTIEYTIDETAMDGSDRDVVNVTAWLDRRANLRRPFTSRYVPRHRADGPAL